MYYVFYARNYTTTRAVVSWMRFFVVVVVYAYSIYSTIRALHRFCEIFMICARDTDRGGCLV